jgi:hypothetical protein
MSRTKENKRFQVQLVIGTGWIHTHGMADRGYPELEAQLVFTLQDDELCDVPSSGDGQTNADPRGPSNDDEQFLKELDDVVGG